MKLYHYLDAEAYGALLREGRIVGSRRHSVFPEFERPYAWLADVMRERIGEAPLHADGQWPVFSWHSRDGLGPVAYDRQSDDESDLLVGFDVPEGHYVLSDFVDWHYVLNGWFMPESGGEDEDLDGQSDRFDELCAAAGYEWGVPGPGGPCREVEEARGRHWTRIVDRPHDNGDVQATSWELRLEWMFFVRVRRRAGLCDGRVQSAPR